VHLAYFLSEVHRGLTDGPSEGTRTIRSTCDIFKKKTHVRIVRTRAPDGLRYAVLRVDIP
jgi:hypothetical protein